MKGNKSYLINFLVQRNHFFDEKIKNVALKT